MSTSLHETAHSLVNAELATANLRRYFESFTGRLFEQLTDADHPDEFTACDLIAVEALSVRTPIEVAHSILNGDLGRAVNRLLAHIPTHVNLGDPGADQHLASGSAADQAWRLLTRQDGVKWVTASKLLATKRPGLLPVYDEVVRCALGNPESYWLSLNSAFAEGLTSAVADVRVTADVPQNVSNLRVFDVIVWMSHEEEHRQGCKA